MTTASLPAHQDHIFAISLPQSHPTIRNIGPSEIRS
jgi:hypothetical protein